MRRGCIAVGKVVCDSCQRVLKYGERYLLVEQEGDQKQRLCIDCCQSRGYVSRRTEKETEILTFLSTE